MRMNLTKSSDPCYIPMMENIRALFKNTVFAHPDDVTEMEKAAIKATSKAKK